MGRTPVRTLKARVSCESIDVPEYQPLTERLPMSSGRGDTCIDSAAPTISSVPLTARPPCTAPIASPLVAVARMTLAPPSLRSSADGSCAGCRCRPMRRVARQRLLVLAAQYRLCETHFRCVLNAEMAESAEPEHGDDVARLRTAVPQGIEGCEARAHEWCRLDRPQVFRHARDRAGGGDHKFTVATVKCEASDLSAHTGEEIAAATWIAVPAVASVPTHAHSLALLPSQNSGSDRIDYPGHFVARDPRILNALDGSLFDE